MILTKNSTWHSQVLETPEHVALFIREQSSSSVHGESIVARMHSVRFALGYTPEYTLLIEVIQGSIQSIIIIYKSQIKETTKIMVSLEGNVATFKHGQMDFYYLRKGKALLHYTYIHRCLQYPLEGISIKI